MWNIAQTIIKKVREIIFHISNGFLEMTLTEYEQDSSIVYGKKLKNSFLDTPLSSF